MSIQAIAWAFEQQPENSNQKLVLIAIANYADGDGVCWPGQRSLARDCTMGDRTVRRHLQALEEAGYLEREERRRADGTRTSDRYRLKLDKRPDWPLEQTTLKRPLSTDQAARLARHEPSVEPSANLRSRGEPPETDNAPPLAGLSVAQLRRYRAARSDEETEAAALLLATRHRPAFVDLCRLADRHKPDAQAWGAWLRDASEHLTDESMSNRFLQALATTLATPHVRNPWALLNACMRSGGPRASQQPSYDLEADLRAKYPEAFA